MKNLLILSLLVISLPVLAECEDRNYSLQNLHGTGYVCEYDAKLAQANKDKPAPPKQFVLIVDPQSPKTPPKRVLVVVK